MAKKLKIAEDKILKKLNNEERFCPKYLNVGKSIFYLAFKKPS